MTATTLHSLDLPEEDALGPDKAAALSTIEAQLLRSLAGTAEPQAEARRLLHTTLEAATAVSLSPNVACTSTLAAPLHLDLALLACADQRPRLGAQIRCLDLSDSSPGLRALAEEARRAGFSSVDLKTVHGPIQPVRGLKTWCHEVRPKYFALWCIRADDDQLFDQARSLLNSLSGYCDAVGALFYRERPGPENPRLEKRAAPELSLGFALREMALEMVEAARRGSPSQHAS